MFSGLGFRGGPAPTALRRLNINFRGHAALAADAPDVAGGVAEEVADRGVADVGTLDHLASDGVVKLLRRGLVDVFGALLLGLYMLNGRFELVGGLEGRHLRSFAWGDGHA